MFIYNYYYIMSSVLEILSYEELLTRKTNLIKQLEKVDHELLKRNFNNDNDNIMTIKNIDENNNLENSLVNINSKKIKIKLNIVRIK